MSALHYLLLVWLGVEAVVLSVIVVGCIYMAAEDEWGKRS